MTESIECPTCGETGFANEKGMKKHHYMVHGESLAVVEVECYECGETIEKYEYNIVGRTFCDSGCYGKTLKRETPSGEDHPDYNGGRNWQTYGGCWERRRKRAIKRDFDRCRLCRSSHEQLHVHHRTPHDYFDSHDRASRLENLLTVCPSCHSMIENSNMVP